MKNRQKMMALQRGERRDMEKNEMQQLDVGRENEGKENGGLKEGEEHEQKEEGGKEGTGWGLITLQLLINAVCFTTSLTKWPRLSFSLFLSLKHTHTQTHFAQASSQVVRKEVKVQAFELECWVGKRRERDGVTEEEMGGGVGKSVRGTTRESAHTDP